MWSVASWLSTIASVLSAARLIQEGFAVGLVAPLTKVLTFYNAFVGYLLNWTEPYLKQAVAYFGEMIHVHLNIFPHWKDIFILMVLYFATEIKTDFARGRFINGTAGAVVGAVIVIVASVGSGTTYLDAPTLNAVLVGFPIAGFIGYAIFACLMTSTFYAPNNQTWRKTFLYYIITTALPYAAIACISVYIGKLFEGKIPNPNLIALGSFVLLVTVYWFIRGVWLSLTDKNAGESTLNRFRRAGSGRFALTMLRIIGGIFVFFALNAGL